MPARARQKAKCYRAYPGCRGGVLHDDVYVCVSIVAAIAALVRRNAWLCGGLSFWGDELVALRVLKGCRGLLGWRRVIKSGSSA